MNITIRENRVVPVPIGCNVYHIDYAIKIVTVDGWILMFFVLIAKLFIDEYESPPWDALVYLTSECNYGGRITDDHDRRLINSLLKLFYCEQVVLDDSYRFFHCEEYFAPKFGTYESYVNFIRNLPRTPHPMVSVAANIFEHQVEMHNFK